jgi:hypothetical protein
LIARFQNFSDQIENGHSHRTNGTVLRSCSSPSSPSSSGAVSGSNGFEAVSNGWYSLAIKPEKMRERRERNHKGSGTKKKKERADFGSPGFFSKKQRRRTNREEKGRTEGTKKGERLKKNGGKLREEETQNRRKKRETRRATENGGKYWGKTNNKKLRGRQGQVEAEEREGRVPS